MRQARTILVIIINLLFAFVALAQHPNREKIDSLKKKLPFLQGIKKIDCYNALSEEYWWPPRVFPDSISCWAIVSNQEAVKINYAFGIAKSNQHLGVAEIYRKNFISAENYLEKALPVFEMNHDNREIGWCNLWLGQILYGENNFKDAITCFVKSVRLLEKSSDYEGVGKTYAWISFLYEATGEYDSSFYYCNKSLMIRQQMSDDVCIAGSLMNMGHLYKVAGAFDDALDYYRQGLAYANTHNFNVRTTNWNNVHESIGTIYRLKNMSDSSIYYLQQAMEIDPGSQVTRISFGETLLMKNQDDSALAIFLHPIVHFRQQNNNWDLMRVLLDAGKAYDGKNNETAALQYASEGLLLAKNANVKPLMIQGYQLLSKIYSQLEKNDSAYFFSQQYISLKDSVNNKQFLWRLANYKRQDEFRKQIEEVTSLDKDNKVKAEKLKQAAQLKWILIVCLLIAASSGFIVYRNQILKRKNDKLENQKTQSELQLKATGLEMQALRAQMNPHFIFNCLSSINRFILKNEAEAASDYLTKFSRLIRMVLTNSTRTFITLEDELDMLKLYLGMERLRFKNSFDYVINITNSIDVSSVFVPPLLLQPFVENAIWHGLMNKEGQGLLEIDLSVENRILTCVITDNGIGRNKSVTYKSNSMEKQQSMGLKITTERLALFNKSQDEKTFFTVEDIADDEGKAAGTRIVLKINYRGLVEVMSET